ncbi:MAG: prepilin-type N-terminal cleavage/methylation domain-containing protein [Patescibacteria group bacterium]
MRHRKGFTLIELLVVIAIIGLLATIGMVAFGGARSKARDAKRLADMKTIATALEMYKLENGRYPDPMNEFGGMDVSNIGNNFLPGLSAGGFLPRDVLDPTNDTTHCYFYYRYYPDWHYCNDATFYILGVTNFEATTNPHPNNPHFECPGRNWTAEGASWVQGAFE